MLGLDSREMSHMNEGNPMSLGQQPLSFNRSVLGGLIAYNSRHKMNLSSDVLKRVEYYHDMLPCQLGAYSDSRGHQFIRDNVKQFIIKRDRMEDNIA